MTIENPDAPAGRRAGAVPARSVASRALARRLDPTAASPWARARLEAGAWLAASDAGPSRVLAQGVKFADGCQETSQANR
jgi:hypothetical protein